MNDDVTQKKNRGMTDNNKKIILLQAPISSLKIVERNPGSTSPVVTLRINGFRSFFLLDMKAGKKRSKVLIYLKRIKHCNYLRGNEK